MRPGRSGFAKMMSPGWCCCSRPVGGGETCQIWKPKDHDLQIASSFFPPPLIILQEAQTPEKKDHIPTAKIGGLLACRPRSTPSLGVATLENTPRRPLGILGSEMPVPIEQRQIHEPTKNPHSHSFVPSIPRRPQHHRRLCSDRHHSSCLMGLFEEILHLEISKEKSHRNQANKETRNCHRQDCLLATLPCPGPT